MKKRIEKQAIELYNQCCLFGSSYLSVLNAMYETACKKQDFVKAAIINEMITEELEYC